MVFLIDNGQIKGVKVKGKEVIETEHVHCGLLGIVLAIRFMIYMTVGFISQQNHLRLEYVSSIHNH